MGSMLIVLPNAGTSTQDLVQRLGDLDLASIRTNGKLAMTSIFIPKFKLKFKTYLKQQFRPVQMWPHPAQTLQSAARCSGTSPTHWTTQPSVTKLNPKARSLTGCGRTELSARRAEISSTTSCQNLAAHSGATLQLPSLPTGRRKQTRVESGGARVLRAGLNPSRLRGGAKQSRTSSKLPSSFNAETESMYTIMYYV